MMNRQARAMPRSWRSRTTKPRRLVVSCILGSVCLSSTHSDGMTCSGSLTLPCAKVRQFLSVTVCQLFANTTSCPIPVLARREVQGIVSNMRRKRLVWDTEERRDVKRSKDQA